MLFLGTACIKPSRTLMKRTARNTYEKRRKKDALSERKKNPMDLEKLLSII